MQYPRLYLQNGIQAREDAINVINTHFYRIKPKPYCTVMDIGCGPGNVTHDLVYPHFLNSLNQLIGTDRSKEMIEFARKSYHNHPNIFFDVMDISATKIPTKFEESFDHIVSFYCLHLVNDHKTALSNMYKMLKPGGNVFLSFMGNCIIFDVYEALTNEKDWKMYLKDQKVGPPTQKSKQLSVDFKNTLEEIGFAVDFVQETNKEYVYTKEQYEDSGLVDSFYKDFCNNNIESCDEESEIDSSSGSDKEESSDPEELLCVPDDAAKKLDGISTEVAEAMTPVNFYNAYLDASTRATLILENFKDEVVNQPAQQLNTSSTTSSNVLDVGCGPGNVTHDLLYPQFSSSINQLIGIDRSQEMIRFAKNSYGNHPKLSFDVMDISATGIPQKFRELFDHIISFYCLHMVCDHRTTLSNMYKMLKPGGNVFLNFMGTCVIFEIYEALANETDWKIYLENQNLSPPTQSSKHPAADFKKVLKEVGFTVQFVQETNKDCVYTKQQFKDIAIAVNQFKFPPSFNKKFVLYQMDYLRNHNLVDIDLNGNEYFHQPYSLLTVLASKPN
ncbi:hypothetical protein RN001_004769 [Aquatica leii]|uniref:Juvenile hormone acid methyltransferase n=1 Tax=Aquatica leii TaxID=1421715 RepID=A0AAN7Q643_9COLE|nr:hypothetical protein RN001_004769 [Aquatica leii]